MIHALILGSRVILNQQSLHQTIVLLFQRKKLTNSMQNVEKSGNNTVNVSRFVCPFLSTTRTPHTSYKDAVKEKRLDNLLAQAREEYPLTTPPPPKP